MLECGRATAMVRASTVRISATIKQGIASVNQTEEETPRAISNATSKGEYFAKHFRQPQHTYLWVRRSRSRDGLQGEARSSNLQEIVASTQKDSSVLNMNQLEWGRGRIVTGC